MKLIPSSFKDPYDVRCQSFGIHPRLVQLQDSRIFDTTTANRFNTTLFRDEFDLRQAYVDLKVKEIAEALTLRVGRQELLYGDQRLVGGFDWSNTAQSFDGVKLIYAGKNFSLEGFLTEKVLIDMRNPNNWYDDAEGFHGAYATYKEAILTFFPGHF